LQGSSDIVTLRIQKNDMFPGENALNLEVHRRRRNEYQEYFLRVKAAGA
jgi:hypothetical protein